MIVHRHALSHVHRRLSARRCGLALVAVITGIAAGPCSSASTSPGLSATSRGQAATPRHGVILRQQTFSTYTGATPAVVVAQLEKDAVRIGSSYSLGPSSVSQQDLNSIGGALVNAVPWNTVEFKQDVLSLSGSATAVGATFSCPAPNTLAPAEDFQSMSLFAPRTAVVVPCPSELVVQLSAPVNLNDPLLASAFARFEADPFRTGKVNAGFHAPYDLYRACQTDPESQQPAITLKYAEGAVTVDYGRGEWFGDSSPWCDLVGKFTEEASVQVEQPGKRHHFAQVGPSALHEDGLREILASNYSLPPRYDGETLRIPVGQLCGHRALQILVRIRMTDRFQGDSDQRFQSLPDGVTYGTMLSASATYYSPARNVCAGSVAAPAPTVTHTPKVF